MITIDASIFDRMSTRDSKKSEPHYKLYPAKWYDIDKYEQCGSQNTRNKITKITKLIHIN